VHASPGALILPARGWPPGSFDAYPPDPRQRLYYLRGVTTSQPEPQPQPQPQPQLDAAATEVAALTASAGDGTVPLASAPAGQPHLAWRQRLMLALHGTMHEPEPETPQEQRRDTLLDEAVRRRDLWTGQWTGGINIIGDTNIGEVRCDWASRQAMQLLWWWQPGTEDRPAPATVYRASLQPPDPADAPPLP
jgi:hypothetical protein